MKARKNLNYLRHFVPYCLPSKVKFNLFSACVMSSLLQPGMLTLPICDSWRSSIGRGYASVLVIVSINLFCLSQRASLLPINLLIVIWSSSALFKAKVVFPSVSISVLHDLTDVAAAAKQVISLSIHASNSWSPSPTLTAFKLL